MDACAIGKGGEKKKKDCIPHQRSILNHQVFLMKTKEILCSDISNNFKNFKKRNIIYNIYNYY